MKKKNSIIICFFFLYALAFSGYGQGTGCTTNPFELVRYAGCSPFTVRVDAEINEDYAYCYWDCNSSDFEYTQDVVSDVNLESSDSVTNFTIKRFSDVEASSDPCDQTLTHTVSVFNPTYIIPEVEAVACNDGSVWVDVVNKEELPYSHFALDLGSGVFGSESATLDTVAVSELPKVYSSIYELPSQRTIRVEGLFNRLADENTIAGTTTFKPVTEDISQTNILDKVQVVRTDRSEGIINVLFDRVNISENIQFHLEIDVNSSNDFSYRSIPVEQDTIKVTDLNTQDNYYCFRVVAYNPCTDEREPLGNRICSAVFTRQQADADNYEIDLTWDTELFDGATFQLKREDLQNPLVESQVLPPNTYSDSDIRCGNLYKYILSVYDASGEEISITESLFIEAESNQTPSAIPEGFASVEGSQILLIWEDPVDFPADTFYIERSMDGGDFELAGTTTTTNFTDTGLTPDKVPYCYRLSYRDECGNVSALSQLICPVFLQGEAFVPDAREALTTLPYGELFWTLYLGNSSSNLVRNYTVLRYNKEGDPIDNLAVGITKNHTDNEVGTPYQVITYKVKATTANGHEVYSNPITLDYTIEPFIPNAFSPNGDQLNDTFRPVGPFIRESKITIYNRWGELIYFERIDDPLDEETGWNGEIKGNPAPRGTYVYQVEVTDFEGNIYIKNGAISIVR